MDYMLTEEMQMLKDMAYKFAMNEVAPVAEKADHDEVYMPGGAEEGRGEPELIGCWIDEQYGELGSGSWATPSSPSSWRGRVWVFRFPSRLRPLGLENVHYYGTHGQRPKYFPAVCAGDAVVAGAYTEQRETDVAGYKTRAVEDGDSYVINGSKMFITNGTVCDWMVVQAITDPSECTRVFPSSSLGEHPRCDADEASREARHPHERHGGDTFEDVRVPKANMVGARGNGFTSS